MLYLVQIITSGGEMPPRIFVNRTRAQLAFVDLVREHCADQGADPQDFAAAKALADSVEEGSPRCCYWELELEEADSTVVQKSLAGQERETILQAASDTQQKALGVQTELRGLTEKLTGLSQELIRFQNLLGEEGEDVAAVAAPPAEAPPEKEPEVLDEKYQTAEWQGFVQSLSKMCGGNWGEFPLISRQDWRQAVYSDQTSLPYWEWTAIVIDQAIERARAGGYAVEEDAKEKGQFAYLTPTGERSEKLYEQEDLAWCAAGLHAMPLDSGQA